MPELTTLSDILVALGLGLGLLAAVFAVALITYLLHLAKKDTDRF